MILATAQGYPITPSDARLGEELETRGACVTAAPWDTISPAKSNGALVILRSTWDYHHRSREFRHWIQAWDSKPAALWNPPTTVLWNMDKIYLRDLADRGVALPPTHWSEPGERPGVEGFFARTGARAAVVKPRISATAWGTRLLDSGADLEGADATPLVSSGAVVQAFVPEIRTRGELSLIYVDGRFGHAVRKRPAAGDFRVQSEFGGGIEPCEVGDEERAFGETVLAAAPHPWLYARVDLVQTAKGPVLMELELIEPSLFFESATGRKSAAALAEAILRAAGDPNPAGSPGDSQGADPARRHTP